MKLSTLQAHCTVDPQTTPEGENRVRSLCYTINFRQHWFVPLKFIQFSCEEHFPINSWSEGNTFLVHIHIPCVHRRTYLSRQIKKMFLQKKINSQGSIVCLGVQLGRLHYSIKGTFRNFSEYRGDMGTLSDCWHLKINLKKKFIYMLNVLIKSEIFFLLLIEDFFDLPPVSTTPVVHPKLRISPRIFEKIRNGLMGYSGTGETYSWKKPEVENLVTLSL
jgi:hypothetical protein